VALLTCEQPRCVELEQISAKWNVSARTIRRRLEAEGVQYEELCMELCMEIAMKWLALEGIRPVGAADRLGYREVNSFRRAFRRHFGTTPGGVQTARSRNDESS
jgi:AraC-like DNA-binding protein